jgi:hypothetical protein
MTSTAASAVSARSRASRSRSMPSSPTEAYGRLVKTASFPMTTPCSLAPISAPQIQNGLDNSTAWVRSACGIVTQVHVTVAPEG